MTISMENEYVDLMKELSRGYEIEGVEGLFEVLSEHQAILNFAPWVADLKGRAETEKLRLVFHVFADKTDDFIEDPGQTLMLYLKHRADGEPNVRLWYELQDESEDGEMEEENHMIGYGGYPD